MDVEAIAAVAVDCGLSIHRKIGSGLLESAYEAILAHSLERRAFFGAATDAYPDRFDGLVVDGGFRADILVENVLLIELKSVDRLMPIHAKQVLTYLRFLELPVGLLMNFGGYTFKEGLRRLVNENAKPARLPFDRQVDQTRR